MAFARTLLPALFVMLAASCGGASGPEATTPTRTPGTVTDRMLDALVIPPGSESLTALRELEALADAGHVDASWRRAHYLLDVFDSARFAQDAASRNLLAEIAGRPRSAMRGSAATQAIAELLILEADRILELDRNHVQGQRLRVLAAYDANPPETRTRVSQAMQELKRIARQGGPMAAGATLRLFGYCRSALADAGSLSRPGQRVALSHCLYPLFEADPEPYFAEHATLRPPPPHVDRIVKKQQELLAGVPAGRLAAAYEAQKAWLADFVAESRIFPPIDPQALRLATSDDTAPYDDAPIFSGREQDLPALASEVRADGRHRVAVALAADQPASELISAGRLLEGTDIDTLSLLVATRQKLRVPRGDYWATAVGDVLVWRAGELPFSLAALTSEGSRTRERDSEAKGKDWSRQRSSLELHLVVAPDRWTLLSPLGTIAVMPIGDKQSSPLELLRGALRKVRHAFPDEQGLVIIPAEGTSVGAVVLAAEATRHDENRADLFPRLALGAEAPRPRGGKTLVQRIDRRAAVRVSVNPETLSSKLPAALRCYRNLADARLPRGGEVRLELGDDRNVTTTGATKDLQRCASEAFANSMAQEGLAAATVQFSAIGK